MVLSNPSDVALHIQVVQVRGKNGEITLWDQDSTQVPPAWRPAAISPAGRRWSVRRRPFKNLCFGLFSLYDLSYGLLTASKIPRGSCGECDISERNSEIGRLVCRRDDMERALTEPNGTCYLSAAGMSVRPSLFGSVAQHGACFTCV